MKYMKTKHIIVATSAAIIVGSIVYRIIGASKTAVPALKPASLAKTGKEKIRQVMHLAKENYS